MLKTFDVEYDRDGVHLKVILSGHKNINAFVVRGKLRELEWVQEVIVRIDEIQTTYLRIKPGTHHEIGLAWRLINAALGRIRNSGEPKFDVEIIDDVDKHARIDVTETSGLEPERMLRVMCGQVWIVDGSVRHDPAIKMISFSYKGELQASWIAALLFEAYRERA